MTPRIAVTGSLAYDYISVYDQPFQSLLVPEKLHELSVCFVVSSKERHFGGTAGNIAYNLALLNEPSTILAGAGHDFADYRKHLEKLGVDLSSIRVSPDLPLASATIISDPHGHQISEFYPGAMGKGLKPSINALQGVDVVLIAPDDPTWMMEYVDLCKQFGRRYFFDPGQALGRFTPEQLLHAIEGAEGVFVNDYELELLKRSTGYSEEQLFPLCRIFVVTYGEKGSKIFSEKKVIEIPIATPKQVLEPTGCGDAYRAGFLKGYLDGRELLLCGEMGALLATYVVEQKGTQNHTFNLKGFGQRFETMFKKRL